jgi:hypothetical protein
MSMTIFKGTGKYYIKYLVVDDKLRLLTPLFSNDSGLATFKEQFAEARELKDQNLPAGTVEHVHYHEELENRILQLFDEDLRGSTTNGKHGHFPLPEKKKTSSIVSPAAC